MKKDPMGAFWDVNDQKKWDLKSDLLEVLFQLELDGDWTGNLKRDRDSLSAKFSESDLAIVMDEHANASWREVA